MRVDLHIHHHFDGTAAMIGRDGGLERAALGRILTKLEKIMHSLEEVLAETEAQTTEIGSLKTFIAGLQKQIGDALGGQLTPSQQMRVDQIFNAVQANTESIDAAIKANAGNDPAAPTADPVPSTDPVATPPQS